MSKIISGMKSHVEDENDAAAKLVKVKKLAMVEPMKRAALGDLQNRAQPRAAETGKEAAQKELKDGKIGYGLRTTKARVDSNWKKPVLGQNNNNANRNSTDSNDSGKSQGAPAAIAGQRKLGMRSSSMRVGISAVATAKMLASGRVKELHRPGSAGSTLAPSAVTASAASKPKTLTTKMVESKVQHVKYVTKTIIPAEEKIGGGLASTGANTLRREDSNLTRKQLTQLKAAMQQRDIKPAVVKTEQEPVTVVRPRGYTAATVKAPLVKSEPTTTTTLVPAVPADEAELSDDSITDIDAGDSNNLILVSEYVNDIYKYLFQLEKELCIREHHLEGQVEVFPKMRAVLIDWINEVHVQFKLAAETFQIAVAIIDRYLQVVKDTKRFLLQLVGVTALFIAAKYEELYPPAIADFVYITDNTYTMKQILQMELQIFKALDCNLSRPLPIQFLRRFSKAADVEDIHHCMSKYFIELTMLEYDMASYKPSEVAAASLFLALNLLRENPKRATGFNDKHWNATMQWYSGYRPSQLRPIARRIATIARDAPNAKLKAIYNKYEKLKMQKVALFPSLCGPLIESIIKSKD